MDRAPADGDAMIVTLEGFPDGLRCADCDEELVQGERYSVRIEGMVEDVPLTVVVCIRCADSKGELL